MVELRMERARQGLFGGGLAGLAISVINSEQSVTAKALVLIVSVSTVERLLDLS